MNSTTAANKKGQKGRSTSSSIASFVSIPKLNSLEGGGVFVSHLSGGVATHLKSAHQLQIVEVALAGEETTSVIEMAARAFFSSVYHSSGYGGG